MLRLQCSNLRGLQFDAGEDEPAAHQDRGDAAERIESLREIDALCRALCRSKLNDEWAGCRFKKRQPTCNDEERHQKEPILRDDRRGPEEDAARTVEAQSDQDVRPCSRRDA